MGYIHLIGVERPNNCPPEYVLIQDKCFYLTDSKETYINAKTQCSIKGGKMYEPRDAETLFILVEYLKVKIKFLIVKNRIL